jgi:hypothetical protein
MNKFRALTHSKSIAETKEKNVDGIKNLDLLGKSNDKQWKIYKFTFSFTDKNSTTMDKLDKIKKMYDKFT